MGHDPPVKAIQPIPRTIIKAYVKDLVKDECLIHKIYKYITSAAYIMFDQSGCNGKTYYNIQILPWKSLSIM